MKKDVAAALATKKLAAKQPSATSARLQKVWARMKKNSFKPPILKVSSLLKKHTKKAKAKHAAKKSQLSKSKKAKSKRSEANKVKLKAKRKAKRLRIRKRKRTVKTKRAAKVMLGEMLAGRGVSRTSQPVVLTKASRTAKLKQVWGRMVKKLRRQRRLAKKRRRARKARKMKAALLGEQNSEAAKATAKQMGALAKDEDTMLKREDTAVMQAATAAVETAAGHFATDDEKSVAMLVRHEEANEKSADLLASNMAQQAELKSSGSVTALAE